MGWGMQRQGGVREKSSSEMKKQLLGVGLEFNIKQSRKFSLHSAKV